MTLDQLRTVLEDVVTAIYDERIDNLPAIEQDGAGFSLLCGLWAKESGTVQLVSVGRQHCLIRDRPEAAGFGSYLAKYLIETLGIDNMTPRSAVRLMGYILQKAKAHVQYCRVTGAFFCHARIVACLPEQD